MKQIAKFLIGSRAFFDGMDGFKPKDYDWLYVMDSFGNIRVPRLRLCKEGNDLVFIPKKTKEEYITEEIEKDSGIGLGKFFVPSFAEYIGMTVDDLRRLEPYLDRLDDKHDYYKLIFKYYIENNQFSMTDEQRVSVFEQYNKQRN